MQSTRLIIAILIAIGIPTSLVGEQANKRAAHSNLSNALTAEKTSYANTEQYVKPAVEPSLDFTPLTPTAADGSQEPGLR